MGDPIINTQVDAINTTLGNIKLDLAALRPSIRAIRDAIAETYITDTIENVPIASFSDGADEIPVRELQVAINPIQSLNGQTSPYPAGGGKNKFDNAGLTSTSNTSVTTTTTGFVLKVLTAGTYKSTTLRIDGNFASQTIYFSATVVNSGSNNGSISFRPYDSNNAEIAGHRLDYGANNSGTVKSATMPAGTAYLNAVCYSTTNNTAAVNDTATFTNVMLSLENASYSPYSNICPISGHTDAVVTRTGVNVWGGLKMATDFSVASGYTIDTANKTFTFTRRGGSVNNMLLAGGFKPNTAYTLHITYSNNGSNSSVRLFYTDGTDLAVGLANSSGVKTSVTVVTDASKTLASISLGYYATASTTVYYDESGLIEGANSAFASYVGTTYPFSLGQTVYGGTLNGSTGVMTIDRAKFYPEATSASAITMSDGNSGYRFSNYNSAVLHDISKVNKTISNIFVYNNNWSFPNCICPSSADSKTMFYVLDASLGITTASAFNSWITTNDYYAVIYLATPITVQLTAAEVETLFGANNVWCSSGNIIKLVYRVGWEHWLAEHPSE